MSLKFTIDHLIYPMPRCIVACVKLVDGSIVLLFTTLRQYGIYGLIKRHVECESSACLTRDRALCYCLMTHVQFKNAIEFDRSDKADLRCSRDNCIAKQIAMRVN